MVGFAPDREQGPSGSREGGAIVATGESEAAHGAGRQGGEIYLPVLRGWVWAARVRQGRRDHPDRGRPGQPDIAGQALSKGGGLAAVRTEPGAPVQGQVSPPLREGVGRARPRASGGHDRRPGHKDPRRDLAGQGRDGGRRGAQVPSYARYRSPGPRHARQRRELPDEEALHGDGRGAGREPGTNMTLLHGPRTGDLVW